MSRSSLPSITELDPEVGYIHTDLVSGEQYIVALSRGQRPRRYWKKVASAPPNYQPPPPPDPQADSFNPLDYLTMEDKCPDTPAADARVLYSWLLTADRIYRQVGVQNSHLPPLDQHLKQLLSSSSSSSSQMSDIAKRINGIRLNKGKPAKKVKQAQPVELESPGLLLSQELSRIWLDPFDPRSKYGQILLYHLRKCYPLMYNYLQLRIPGKKPPDRAEQLHNLGYGIACLAGLNINPEYQQIPVLMDPGYINYNYPHSDKAQLIQITNGQLAYLYQGRIHVVPRHDNGMLLISQQIIKDLGSPLPLYYVDPYHSVVEITDNIWLHVDSMLCYDATFQQPLPEGSYAMLPLYQQMEEASDLHRQYLTNLSHICS